MCTNDTHHNNEITLYPSHSTNIIKTEYEISCSYKQWEVIALKQLTSHIEQPHNNRDPCVAYDNSTSMSPVQRVTSIF